MRATTPPLKVQTYCTVCNDSTPHYFEPGHSTDDQSCYECSRCGHKVFANEEARP